MYSGSDLDRSKSFGEWETGPKESQICSGQRPYIGDLPRARDGYLLGHMFEQ